MLIDFDCEKGAKGTHLGMKHGTKIDPKPIQNRSQKSRGNKTDPRRSWTRLGAILGRLGAPSWVKKRLKPFVLNGFVNNHFFEDKTVRRRFGDQPWPTKAPKWSKMTPKTQPKSTPRRSKIDINIDIKNDAKSKRAEGVLTRRHWAGTPPQGAPGRRPRDPGEAAQAPRDL